MESLTYLLGPLGCAIGMLVLMAFMARGTRHPPRGVDPKVREAADLRAEITELRGKRSGGGDA